VDPLAFEVTWIVALPLTLNGTWKVISLADSDATGAAWPFTSTCTPLQFVVNGRTLEQVNRFTVPKFEPVIFATIPGAIVPAANDAAFNTPALVNAGV
jgi:hypothetical protein